MQVTAPLRPEADDFEHLSSAELARLVELSQGLSGSLDFGLVLDRVVGAARDLLGTDMSTLLLLDEERAFLTVRAHAGIDPSVARRLSTPVGQNLAGRVAATGQAMRSVDIACDERSTLGGVCEGHIRSAMLVPLLRDQQVLGVLAVETRELRDFSEREQALLELLANHAAAAIETARLYAIEHEQVQRLRTLLERLNTQNDVMRRSRDAHDRLAEAALEGVGHQSLLQMLVELVPAPMAMVNQFGARLGATAPERDPRLEELWTRCESNAAFLSSMQRLRSNAGLAQPAPERDAGFWRLVPIVAAGEALGAIVVLDHSELEELHILILEEAASIIAAELLRERSVAEAEARSHGDLLRAVLLSDTDSEHLQERAALLGLDLSADQAVVAISASGGKELPEPSVLTGAGRRAAARAGVRGLYGTVDGNGVVLLSAADRALSRESVARWLEHFRDELRGRGEAVEQQFGVSEIPCAGADVREAVAHARQASAVCRLADDCPVTYFEDVELIATLIDITNDDAVGRYIERMIGRLEDYDSRKRTALADTLETYLDCSGVARHAAKALYLHPHSLRYRLRRIAEIQEIDLSDPMVRLTTHLALKLRSLVTRPAQGANGHALRATGA
jgi:GAF domain-containing protein